MADKRYQVFISSTFTDLQEERDAVAKALMDVDHIPAGMEHFPASDEEQFEFIQRVIDISDYYLVIIGARYGSMSAEGISYTEKEFDYARERGKKVIALIHGKPEGLPFDKSEGEPAAREKLQAFRAKLQDKRLTKYWQDTGELTTGALAGLTQAIKHFPAVGWVRGDQVAGVEILSELNELRKKNAELESRILAALGANKIPDLVGLDDTFIFAWADGVARDELASTWGQIFAVVAHAMELNSPKDYILGELAKAVLPVGTQSFTVDTAETIQATLEALDLIEVTTNDYSRLNWEQTPHGREVVQHLRAARKPKRHDA